ncbi:hypothetical protein SteCoe_26434 [Stentor coeruleus]|uniref:START domain-containing protein n=1 Tax=Stentor coeruleus TaxID=5963 RepID=A0A1R2BCX9_9CILI|nr:hypothetical protein SteCoe_26434 [Stentor coeruleus]
METEETSFENKELSGYLKIKRSLFWARRFIVLKSGILYYYKTATATSPRGLYHLSGLKINKDQSEMIVEIFRENSKTLKIQFSSKNEFNLWFQALTMSTISSEKIAGQPCAYLDMQKSIDKENIQLIDQVPKAQMQGPLKLKIEEIKNRPYKLVGTRGGSIFYCTHKHIIEQKKVKVDMKMLAIGILIILEVVRNIIGNIFSLLVILGLAGYYYSLKTIPEDKPVVDHKYHFKCSINIKSGVGEILTALHDTMCRHLWEPYLNESEEPSSIKLTYIFNNITLNQELIRILVKDSNTFYLLEKVGNEIKNLFIIESKNKKGEFLSQVHHYGCLDNHENPLIGNADILNCLKYFIESNTVYVSSGEILQGDKSSDDEEGHLSQSIVESDSANFYHSEANRVLKEAEALLEEQTGWEDLKLNSRIIKGYRRKAAAGLFVVKAEGEINRSATEIMDVIKDLPRKGGYDTMFESGSIIETIDSFTEICYQKYKGKLGVSPRDFCFLQKRWHMPDGKWIAVATSVTHSLCPETKFVRAHLFMGCHFLTPTGPNSAHDVYMIYVDIRGSIPKFLANTVQVDQAMLIENLRNFLN